VQRPTHCPGGDSDHEKRQFDRLLSGQDNLVKLKLGALDSSLGQRPAGRLHILRFRNW
jgi:hypothetical protein